MTGKRMRLVRSKTSFENMSDLDERLPPPKGERQQRMNPPNNQTIVERKAQQASTQPSKKSSTGTRGNRDHFLERCNFCGKTIGPNDEIYMYGSLLAFCSSECRIQQMLEDKVREMMMCGKAAEALAWHQKMINNLKLTW